MKFLRLKMVDLEGFEPSTSSMPWRRAPNCATGPRSQVFLLTYHSPEEPITRRDRDAYVYLSPPLANGTVVETTHRRID